MYHLASTDSILSPPRYVIFDFDNTLCDSWPQLFEAWNKILILFERGAMSQEEILDLPHKPQSELITDIFGPNSEHIVKAYWEIYEKIHAHPPPLLHSTIRALDALKKKGVYMAIVSNTEGVMLRRHCEALGISHYFSKILGTGDMLVTKPDPRVIFHALPEVMRDSFERETLVKKVLNQEIWYVGDSPSDVLTAKQASIMPIWILEKATQTISERLIDKGKACVKTYPLLKVDNLDELVCVFNTLHKRKQYRRSERISGVYLFLVVALLNFFFGSREVNFRGFFIYAVEFCMLGIAYKSRALIFSGIFNLWRRVAHQSYVGVDSGARPGSPTFSRQD